MSPSVSCVLSRSYDRKLFVPTFYLLALLGMIVVPSTAFALDSYTIQDNFYRLMTGGFGTLVMIFAGAGGIATVYMQRSGRAGDRVPIYGVVLMIVAVVIFTIRVMVTAGVVGFRGNEYQGYDVSERGY